MSTTGYSGTPLLKKLGIKPDMKVLLVNQPSDYYSLVATNIGDQLCKKNVHGTPYGETPDFVHLFVKTEKEFISEMKKLESICKRIVLLSFGFPGIRKQQRLQLMLQKILFVTMPCNMIW